MNNFTSGYICACANLMRISGESTPLREVLECSFKSINDLKKDGVDEEDIKVLLPVIKEIISRRRRMKKESIK